MADPAERRVQEQEFLQTLARVRRQNYLAGKLALDREGRERERVKTQRDDQIRRQFAKEYEPMGRQFNHLFMADSFASPDFSSQLMACHHAESLLRDAMLAPSAPPVPACVKITHQTESRRIKLNLCR